MQDGIDASDMILLCPLATLSGSEKSRGITPTKTQTNKNSRNIQKLIYFFIPQNLWQSIWRWRAPCEREWKCSCVLKKWPVGKCSVLSVFPFCTSRKKCFFFLEKAPIFEKQCIIFGKDVYMYTVQQQVFTKDVCQMGVGVLI